VAPSQLTLEISEAGVTSASDRPMPNLRRLHELGYGWRSTISAPVFVVVAPASAPGRRSQDRQAVRPGMATDPGDLAIVRAIVDLSRHFGLAVVAEGVESELTLSC